MKIGVSDASILRIAAIPSCCPKSCSCLPIWFSCCTKSWIAVTYFEKLTVTLDLDYLFAYVGTAVIPTPKYCSGTTYIAVALRNFPQCILGKISITNLSYKE